MKALRSVLVVAILICFSIICVSQAWSIEPLPIQKQTPLPAQPFRIPQLNKPDLIISSFYGPTSAKVGGAIKGLYVTVKNIGTAPAIGGFRIDIVLSRDEIAPVSPGTVSPTYVEDTLLGGGGSVMTILGDLAPLASRTASLSLNDGAIPKAKPGYFYLCATADVNQTIPEINETNNTKCYQIYISDPIPPPTPK